LAAILNAKLLPAPITYYACTCAELPYRILAFTIAFDIVASPQRVWDCIVTPRNRFLSATGSRTLAFGFKWYSRSTLGTTELLVNV